MTTKNTSGPNRKTRFGNPRRLLGVLAAVLAVLVGRWILFEPATATKQTSSSTTTPRSTSQSWTSRLFDRIRFHSGYQVGDVFEYALSYETATDAQGGRVRHLTVDGAWRVQVLEVEPERSRFVVSLKGAKLGAANRGPSSEQEYRATERALAEPVFVTTTPRGVVEALSFGPDAQRAASDIVRSLVALSQTVLPESDGQKRWEAREADVSGKYLAEYRRLEANHWTKRKLKYTEVVSSVMGSFELGVVESEADLTLEDSRILKTLHVRDKVRSTGEQLPELISTSSLTLSRSSQTRDLASRDALQERASKLTALALDKAPETHDDELAIDRAKVGDRNLSDFVQEFAALPPVSNQTDAERRRDRRSFAALAALFRTDEGSIDEAMDLIRQGSDVSSALWDALASAGTPKAQAALRELIQNQGFNDVDRRMQLIGLSFVPKPTVETVQFLTDRVDDPVQGQQARFGLGTALNHLRGDDGKTGQAYAFLTEQLQNAGSPQATSDYLLALGNSAIPAAKPLIEGYVENGDAAVRAAAAQALRFMPGADVEQTLLGLITKDPDGAVRAEAINAVADHPPNRALLDAVFDAAQGDESELARARAVQTLDAWRKKYPAIDEALTNFDRSKKATP